MGMTIDELRDRYKQGERDFSGQTITASSAIYSLSVTSVNLAKTDLSHQIFVDCDFSHATLTGAIFSGCQFRSVKFCHTKLESVNFIGASFQDVDFSGATYDPNTTLFPLRFKPEKHDLVSSAPQTISPSEDKATPVVPDTLPDKDTNCFTVAPFGSVDYPTIGEALANVPAGATIRVKPGLYRESLYLQQPVEIIGDGPIDEIIVEADDGACIWMETDNARVTGLTFRKTATGKYYGVDISQGRLTLENCDISSASSAAVAIYNAGTRPIIRNCTIHDGKMCGLVIYGEASGVIEDCDIFANADSGIEITGSNTNPIIRNCKIHDGKTCGVFIYEEAKAVIEACDIFSNAYSGIEIIESNTNPTIHNCRIYNNDHGIWVSEKATATVIGGKIKNNREQDIRKDTGATVK